MNNSISRKNPHLKVEEFIIYLKINFSKYIKSATYQQEKQKDIKEIFNGAF